MKLIIEREVTLNNLKKYDVIYSDFLRKCGPWELHAVHVCIFRKSDPDAIILLQTFVLSHNNDYYYFIFFDAPLSHVWRSSILGFLSNVVLSTDRSDVIAIFPLGGTAFLSCRPTQIPIESDPESKAECRSTDTTQLNPTQLNSTEQICARWRESKQSWPSWYKIPVNHRYKLI